MCVCSRTCMCVCVCVCLRSRARTYTHVYASYNVFVCVCLGGRGGSGECVCVCVCVRARGASKMLACLWSFCFCFHVNVWTGGERERESLGIQPLCFSRPGNACYIALKQFIHRIHILQRLTLEYHYCSSKQCKDDKSYSRIVEIVKLQRTKSQALLELNLFIELLMISLFYTKLHPHYVEVAENSKTHISTYLVCCFELWVWCIKVAMPAEKLPPVWPWRKKQSHSQNSAWPPTVTQRSFWASVLQKAASEMGCPDWLAAMHRLRLRRLPWTSWSDHQWQWTGS